MRARSWFVFPVVGLLSACAATEPPRITPTQVVVTGVTNTGLALTVKLAVENPNAFELSAQSVNAKVVVGSTVDLGAVSVDRPCAIAPKGTTNLEVPLMLTWESAAPLMPLAQRPTVPYTVDGTVQFGGRVTVTLPFHLDGTLKREELLKAVVIRLPLPM